MGCDIHPGVPGRTVDLYSGCLSQWPGPPVFTITTNISAIVGEFGQLLMPQKLCIILKQCCQQIDYQIWFPFLLFLLLIVF